MRGWYIDYINIQWYNRYCNYINSFIIKRVFKFKKYNPIKFNKVQIFKLRIVNKIKGKATNTLFKKLRLVI